MIWIKKITVTLILTVSGIMLFVQNNIDSTYSRPVNSIYFDLLGDASIISLNYERLFFISPNFMLSAKLGFGYNQEFQYCLNEPCSTNEDNYLTIPHHITGNMGKGKYFLEFGFGGTQFNGKTTQPYLFYGIVGYRISPLNYNKASFSIFMQIPFMGFNTSTIFYTPFGLSVGPSF